MAVVGICCVLGTLVGCNGKKGPAVYPLKGTVIVDGKPTPMIEVSFISKLRTDNLNFEADIKGYTDDQGAVSVVTEGGMGIPAGEYTLTFIYADMNLLSGRYEGKDRFNGKYSDGSKSTFKIKVGPSESNDIGTINLSTK